MGNVYVNLHPTYTFANVVVEGYIKELQDYVRLVDWLGWDWQSIKGKPLIQVFGGFSSDDRAVEKHFERTWMLLQRIMNSGEHAIFIRDSRRDKWTDYHASIEYTEKQMNEVEVQRVRQSDKEKWLKKDIEKFGKMLEVQKDELIQKMMREAMQELEKLEKEEQIRQERIKKVWK